MQNFVQAERLGFSAKTQALAELTNASEQRMTKWHILCRPFSTGKQFFMRGNPAQSTGTFPAFPAISEIVLFEKSSCGGDA